ncbi:hypothetical protein ACSBM8_16700 [Sphingomonas sp. ASY06-1R]|uniref:hypothetical protein n=1 Tax=Sphingomonas sp. ASY06-1R TaxID=3445771 RepID=UPI003FA2F1C6
MDLDRMHFIAIVRDPVRFKGRARSIFQGIDGAIIAKMVLALRRVPLFGMAVGLLRAAGIVGLRRDTALGCTAVSYGRVLQCVRIGIVVRHPHLDRGNGMMGRWVPQLA